PSWPPEEVIPSNKTSPTALRVSWQPISDEYYVHGILLGYKVYYWAVRNPNEVFLKKKEKIIVNAMTLSVVISGLHAYTVYAIQVLAFTSKGDGPLSQLIYGGKLSYTVYAIQVLAFTSKGDGPLSQLIYGGKLSYTVYAIQVLAFTSKGDGPLTQLIYGGKLSYTVYAIQVLAFTSKGDGPLSQLIYG
ncbi:predicted protein, partial [Nematostella vectensis]